MSAVRVVVACRLPGALRFGDRPGEVLASFGEVIDRARDLGGALVATGYDGVAFAWDEAAIEDAVSLATSITHAIHHVAEPGAVGAVWACGIASGEMAMGKARSPGAPPLQWGEPLAVATALARLAKPREVLVDISVPAVVDHELLTNRTRVGQVGRKRVRGFRVDPRRTWRAQAAMDVARMVDPPLVGRDAELERLMEATGVVILRADSGFGGSRLLAEVAARTLPSRSLSLTPFSLVQEPLGALRRAMAFVAATERITLPAKLHPVLDRLLGAQGITLEEAALLIAHQVEPRPGAPLPSILLDDATDLDEPSVEACARAIGILGETGVRVIARIDSMSQLPRTLSRHSSGDEVTLGRLDRDAARAVAVGCTGGALEGAAGDQWARRGGSTPLGVVEAVAAGIAKGDLLWGESSLGLRKRVQGDDIARPVGFWISRHAETLSEGCRDVLIALAHLGGEAAATELVDVVGAVAPEVNLEAEVLALQSNRWIRESRPGFFVLATRAQREAILELSRNDHAREWRSAVAKTLERAPGTLRRAEAAQHAARAGMGEWASRLAMAAARTASQVGLEESASTLAAFAGVQNPASPDLDLGELAIDDDVTVGVSVFPVATDDDDQEDATVARADALPLLEEVSAELDEVVEIERSEPGLGPPGPPLAPVPEPPRTAKSVPPPLPVALAAAAAPVLKAAPTPNGKPKPQGYRAELEAARELRETPWAEVARKALAEGATPEAHRRGLLALARAYANEGKSAEALIYGLDALARMKEARDAAGTRTCLLFLARLYEQTERQPEAATLKTAAQAAL